jgi:capsular exopolysaccharide synthesis family protein
MEVARYVGMFWRWGWLLVLSTAIAAGISYVASSRMPKVYSSATTVMVGEALQDSNPQANDFATSERLATSYAQIVRREPVLHATVDALHLSTPWQALAGQVSAAAAPNTSLIQITVVDNLPDRATAIANEVARQLIVQSPTPNEQQQDQQQKFVAGQLTDLQTKITDAQSQISSLEARLSQDASARTIADTQGQIAALQQRIVGWQTTYAGLMATQTGRTNNLRVVDPAVASDTPISPNIRLNVMAAAGVGFALAIAAILGLEYLDDTLKSAEDVHRVLNLPTLGYIGRLGRGERGSAASLRSGLPASPAAEAFRGLRTNLQFSTLDSPPELLLITSAVPGEGKTTTASNLAISMTQTGMRVILCDTDLRRPSMHRLFDLPEEPGLTSLLIDGELGLESALHATQVPELYVLPAGPVPPHPAELLGSRAMKQRVAEMEQFADIVIFDSPALLPVSDGAVLGAVLGNVLYVVDSANTRSDVARRGLAVLEQVGVKPVGVILTKLRDTQQRYSSYYRADSSAQRQNGSGSVATAWSKVQDTGASRSNSVT